MEPVTVPLNWGWPLAPLAISMWWKWPYIACKSDHKSICVLGALPLGAQWLHWEKLKQCERLDREPANSAVASPAEGPASSAANMNLLGILLLFLASSPFCRDCSPRQWNEEQKPSYGIVRGNKWRLLFLSHCVRVVVLHHNRKRNNKKTANLEMPQKI